MGVLIDTNGPKRISEFILDKEVSVYRGHNDLKTFLGDMVWCMKEWLKWSLRVLKMWLVLTQWSTVPALCTTWFKIKKKKKLRIAQSWKFQAFLDVTLCRRVNNFRRFERSHGLYLQGQAVQNNEGTPKVREQFRTWNFNTNSV